MSANWAADEPDALAALLRALCRCRAMVRRAGNRRELAGDSFRTRRISHVRPAWMLHGLTGELDAGGGDIRRAADFFVPFAKAATFPWKSHALWFYSQMVRWGQVATRREREHGARDVPARSLPRALTPLGVALPTANAKVEGALLRRRRSARPAPA